MKTLIILSIVYLLSVVLCWLTIRLLYKNPKGRCYKSPIGSDVVIVCFMPVANIVFAIVFIGDWKHDKYKKDYSGFFTIFIILLIISCKKIDTKATNQPQQSIQLCVIDTVHYFEGKYISNKVDTISIKYLNSECLNHNQTQYLVHNIKKSFIRYTSRIEDRDYIMTTNEYSRAFSGGIVQLVNIEDKAFFLSFALHDSTYTLRLDKI